MAGVVARVVLRALAAAGRALYRAAKNPAVRRAAVRAAQKAGRAFSRFAQKSKQLCSKAWNKLRGRTKAPEAAAKQAAAKEAAARAAQAHANTLRHIFGQARHKLGNLVKLFGTEEKAFNAVQRATEGAVQSQGIKGVFETVVKVGTETITVRGKVIDGAVRISTFFKP